MGSNQKNQAPSGPSSMETVNDGNIGGQQQVYNGMNSQSWPNFGHRPFDQPGYGYPPVYWPMSWNRPMYGHSPFDQTFPFPYMYGRK